MEKIIHIWASYHTTRFVNAMFSFWHMRNARSRDSVVSPKQELTFFFYFHLARLFFFCSFYWSFAEAVFSSKCFFSWVFLSCLVGVQTNWKGSTFEGSAKSVVFLLESSLDGWLVTNVENEVLEMLDLSSVIETISIPCKCI